MAARDDPGLHDMALPLDRAAIKRHVARSQKRAAGLRKADIARRATELRARNDGVVSLPELSRADLSPELSATPSRLQSAIGAFEDGKRAAVEEGVPEVAPVEIQEDIQEDEEEDYVAKALESWQKDRGRRGRRRPRVVTIDLSQPVVRRATSLPAVATAAPGTAASEPGAEPDAEPEPQDCEAVRLNEIFTHTGKFGEELDAKKLGARSPKTPNQHSTLGVLAWAAVC